MGSNCESAIPPPLPYIHRAVSGEPPPRPAQQPESDVPVRPPRRLIKAFLPQPAVQRLAPGAGTGPRGVLRGGCRPM